MCQPAPLARCANHSAKEMAKIDDNMTENYNKRLDISNKIVEIKREERLLGIDSDPKDRDLPGLSDLNKLRAEYDALEEENKNLVRDSWEQELHIDSTPKGRKLLENDKDAAMRGFRLKNANALNDWQKKLRDMKDSDGNKLTGPGGNLDDRHKVYLQEFISARTDYTTARESSFEADRRLGVLNDSLDGFETRNVGIKNTGGKRIGSRVAVNPEDAEEVDYLERQKTSVLTMQKQAHYDQVLARAKMNRTRKAIQLNRKAQHKAAAEAQEKKNAIAMRREHKEIVGQYSEDLDRASVQLAFSARDVVDRDERMRLSAKAEAVKVSADRLKEFRANSHGNEAKAVEDFRAKTQESYENAKKFQDEAEKSGNVMDRLIFAGERGGLSLVLDKVRSLN